MSSRSVREISDGLDSRVLHTNLSVQLKSPCSHSLVCKVMNSHMCSFCGPAATHTETRTHTLAHTYHLKVSGHFFLLLPPRPSAELQSDVPAASFILAVTNVSGSDCTKAPSVMGLKNDRISAVRTPSGPQSKRLVFLIRGFEKWDVIWL